MSRREQNEITVEQLALQAAQAYQRSLEALGLGREVVLSVQAFGSVAATLWELDGTYTVADLGELARRTYQENAGAVPAPKLPRDEVAWQAVAVVIHAYLGRDPAEYDEVEAVLLHYLEHNGGVLGVPA